MSEPINEAITQLAKDLAVFNKGKNLFDVYDDLRAGIIKDLKRKSEEAILAKEIIDNFHIDLSTAQVLAFGVVCLKQRLEDQPVISEHMRKPRDIEEDHKEAIEMNEELKYAQR